MKQLFYTSLLLFLVQFSFAQNNARLFCKDGCLFTVYVNDRPVNKTVQASVLLEKITKDTLYIKVEFDNKSKFGATLYLLDKTQRTNGKEFNYTIGPEKNKLQVEFTGMYAIVPLPDPIVPKRSAADTIKAKKPEPAAPKPRDGNACVTASSEEAIKTYTGFLRTAATDVQRLQQLKGTYNGYCFSAAHCNTVLQTFMHDRERLDAAKLIYANCVEKEQFLSVTSLFTYPQSVDELKQFVEKQR